MKNLNNYKQIGKTAGLLLAGLFLGWLLFGGSAGHEEADIDQHIEEAHTDEDGNVVYTCSMHPQIRQNEPGNCPICGMELILLNEAAEQEETTLSMTEAAVKLADIQTTQVERRTPELEIRLPGRVAADERRVSSITAQFPGRIEELYVNFTGTYVEKGEKLATIYSPDLISAQRELLEAVRNKEINPALYESARRKLRLLGLPENEIQRIESSRKVTDQIPIVATRSGYVTQKNVDLKDYVNEGTVMYKVADLSRLWVLFDAYETDLGSIDQGDSVNFTVRSHPGKNFEAEITYVDPFINPQTRTARVRAEVENTGGTLKPEMLARGTVTGNGDNGEQLMVPRSAVMWTGKRSVVFVKQQGRDVPTFEPRLVTLGQRAGNYYMIEDGLNEGEEVVTHGNFKLDSAAQLADKLSMMNREPGSRASRAGHDHGTETQTSQVEKDRHQHTEHLTVLIDSYLKVKNALVADEFEGAKKHLVTFKTEVTQSAEMNQHPEHSVKHDKHHAAMLKAVESASKAKNLEQFRSSFVNISENLVKALQNQRYGERELYLQYCPMAEDEKGAYWISENEPIVNPYMGQKMPGCGNVEEILSYES
jgi:Cu(I)/Ag(I) efflux system membrane fusion protein